MNKKIWKRAAFAVAAFAVTLVAAAFVPQSFTASAADVGYRRTGATALGDGLTYETYCENTGETAQKLFYGEAVLGDGRSLVLHAMPNGAAYTLATVKDLAADYESKHQDERVMMAVNGGFFDGAFNDDPHLPEGPLVIDGVLMDDGFSSKTNHKNAFGWTNDGAVFYGGIEQNSQKYTLRTTAEDGARAVFALEADGSALENYGISIYRNGSGHSVRNSVRFSARLRIDDGRKVEYDGIEQLNATADGNAFDVADGEIVIAVRENNAAVQALAKAQTVAVYNATNGKFKDAEYVVDVYNNLVVDGKAASGFNGGGHATTPAPRTTIGCYDDGRVFVAVADGRQADYAVGLTCKQQAEFAEAKGCKYAFELDGGGSSTFIIRTDEGLTVLNKPSDGAMRKVLCAVLVVEKKTTQSFDTLTTQTELRLQAGESGQIELTEGLHASDVTFAVADPSVAAVDALGVVTALKVGITEATVSYGSSSQSVVVVVSAAPSTEPSTAPESEGKNTGCGGAMGYPTAAVLAAAACVVLCLKR